MSRARRVSYFQNVFDLLDYEPPPSLTAMAMIEESEARIGRRLPAALRDWYGRQGVVEIGPPVGQWNVPEKGVWFPLPEADRVLPAPAIWTEQLWYNFVGNYASRYSVPDSLTAVLGQIDGRVRGKKVHAGYARVMVEMYDQLGWMVEWTRSEDPPVWRTDGLPRERWALAADRFSTFVFVSIVNGYLNDGTPVACIDQESDPDLAGPPTVPPVPPKLYGNGLWLRAADEPFHPQVIAYLNDHLGEPERTERRGGVTTFTFRCDGGIVRVTADGSRVADGRADGRAAWWVHAQTEHRLEALARLLYSWNTPGEKLLGEKLVSETRAGEAVLERLKQTGRPDSRS